MNFVNTYEGKKIPPMKIAVKSTGGDTFDYPQNLNTEVGETNSKFGLFRDHLKKTNVSGEYGVLYCKMVNTATSTKEAIPPEYSYRVHQGLGRNEPNGMLNMPDVDRSAKLIPRMDIFSSGMPSKLFKAQ